MTQAAELVGELNGRVSTRATLRFRGPRAAGFSKIGGRYTHGSIRFDAGVFFGLTSDRSDRSDCTAGFTYVFNAFTVLAVVLPGDRKNAEKPLRHAVPRSAP